VTRRIILHIGMAKTASTSMQRAFADNRPFLRAHGIDYPLSGRRGAFGQHDMIKSFIDGDIAAVDAFFDACLDKGLQLDQLLLSAETMCALQGQALAQWKAYLDRRFGDPHLTVWMFVRRTSSWVPSAWQSRIRRGLSDTLPLFAFAMLDRFLRDERLLFESFADDWLAVFPRQSIRIVPMERLIEEDGDLVVSAFRLLLGLDAGSLRDRYRLNGAMTPGTSEFVRAMRMRHATAEDAATFAHALSATLGREASLCREIDRLVGPWLAELAFPDRNPAFLRMERAAAVRYTDQLERGDGPLIFPDTPPKPAPYVQDHCWHDAGLRGTINELYEAIPDHRRWKARA